MDKHGTMQGKLCMVTGATAGIGEVTARALAERGATVVIVGRNRAKCEATVARIRAQTGNDDIEYRLADLSSQAQVHALAAEFKRRHARLHVLVNNAGAYFMQRQETEAGLERTFALNHLAYFLLTNLLLDTLKASAPARVINVSSALHVRGAMQFDDLQATRHYRGMASYAQSKLANVLFTYELARRLEGSGVTVNAVHPGLVASEFAKNNGGITKLWTLLVRVFGISAAEGAQTSIYLATAPEVAAVTGRYFVKEKAVDSSKSSYDAEDARRLWQVSAQLTGLRA